MQIDCSKGSGGRLPAVEGEGRRTGFGGRARLLAGLVVLALLLVACDSSTGPDRPARGDMTLNITGDVELTLEGGALHGQQQLTDQNDDGEDPRTVIVQAINFLPKDNLVGSFELVRVSSEAGFDSGDGVIGLASPQWGAFDPSVVEDQWIVFAVLQDLDGYSGSLYSSDGSVSLPTASGQGQISGTFTANLQGQLERDGSTSPVEIQIVADFDSLPASGGF